MFGNDYIRIFSEITVLDIALLDLQLGGILHKRGSIYFFKKVRFEEIIVGL